MDKRRLGHTDLFVTIIGLGTMTWGSQNTPEEGLAQMDLAFDRGVTFWDTAELYPVPPQEGWWAETERIIGRWFATRGRRQDVVLASKVIGHAPWAGWVRGGAARLDARNIEKALEDSLQRLGTDYLDLYQLHWPDRPTPRFGQLGFDPAADESHATAIEETLEALDGLVAAGKVRHVGLSNETAWGVMRFLRAAELGHGPRMVSIQNAYSLINRAFEFGLAEIAHREQVGLLAYAPVAGGALTGKYLDGTVPAGSRRAFDPRPSRYQTPGADAAIRAYVEIAAEAGITPAQLAIGFVLAQPFVTSALIGATSLAQLDEALAAGSLRLSPDTLEAIDRVHRLNPLPTC